MDFSKYFELIHLAVLRVLKLFLGRKYLSLHLYLSSFSLDLLIFS